MEFRYAECSLKSEVENAKTKGVEESFFFFWHLMSLALNFGCAIYHDFTQFYSISFSQLTPEANLSSLSQWELWQRRNESNLEKERVLRRKHCPLGPFNTVNRMYSC